jgi:hypothetical protein
MEIRLIFESIFGPSYESRSRFGSGSARSAEFQRTLRFIKEDERGASTSLRHFFAKRRGCKRNPDSEASTLRVWPFAHLIETWYTGSICAAEQ